METFIDNLIDLLSGGEALFALLRSTLIIVVAVTMHWFATRAIKSLRSHISAKWADREQVRRAETLGRVLRYLIAVVISLIASMLILNQFGISIAPILGAAGIVGLAVGFGAQSLVRDYFNGICLLLEDQITKGDVVTIVDKTGLVEDVTLPPRLEHTLDDAFGEIAAMAGFEATGHIIDVYGLCADCR